MEFAITTLKFKLHDLQVEKRMWNKQVKRKDLFERIDYEINSIKRAIKFLNEAKRSDAGATD